MSEFNVDIASRTLPNHIYVLIRSSVTYFSHGFDSLDKNQTVEKWKLEKFSVRLVEWKYTCINIHSGNTCVTSSRKTQKLWKTKLKLGRQRHHWICMLYFIEYSHGCVCISGHISITNVDVSSETTFLLSVPAVLLF